MGRGVWGFRNLLIFFKFWTNFDKFEFFFVKMKKHSIFFGWYRTSSRDPPRISNVLIFFREGGSFVLIVNQPAL